MTALIDRLDKRAAILRPPTEEEKEAAPKDDYDQPIIDFQLVVTLWAGIEPLQGNEYFAAMKENAEVTTRIRIRYRTGIDRTMICRYKEMEYEILYIIHPRTAKEELQLMCKERQ